MSKISYVQYLREVYPGKSEYLKMLPAGDPAGDNYGNIHIPGRASISGYRCHGLLGFGGFATVYDVTERPHGLEALIYRSRPHYACKIADLSHASINGGNPVTAAENFLREIELYYAMKRSRVAGVLPLKAHTPIPEIQRAIREARKNPRHTTNIRLMMLTPVGLSYQTYLASLVESGKIRRLTVQQACAMFLDIAEAILQLHKNGILHRDLKPDNIYLYPDQNALRACLADFNVSRAVQIQKGMRGLTQISYSGTAAYASPYLKTHNVGDCPAAGHVLPRRHLLHHPQQSKALCRLERQTERAAVQPQQGTVEAGAGDDGAGPPQGTVHGGSGADAVQNPPVSTPFGKAPSGCCPGRL